MDKKIIKKQPTKLNAQNKTNLKTKEYICNKIKEASL